MNSGVPQMHQSPLSDSLASSRRSVSRAGRRTLRIGLLLLGSISSLLFASSALATPATVGLGKAAPFSVLAGSTITNVGATTMFGNLGLYPGTAVTGEPQVLGTSYVNDQVAIEAKEALTTAFTNAKNRPSEASAGTDLAGHMFSPGVYSASTSLQLSANGSVILNAEGNPDAVFIFQIGTTLTTGSATTVSLTNGAQACNVFWEVGSSATLGSGTQFVGTILALESITANSAATIHGRLLTQTAAVTLENNTLTTSNCPSSESGLGGGTETTSEGGGEGGGSGGGGGSSGGGGTSGGGDGTSGGGGTTTSGGGTTVASTTTTALHPPIASKTTKQESREKTPQSGPQSSSGIQTALARTPSAPAQTRCVHRLTPRSRLRLTLTRRARAKLPPPIARMRRRLTQRVAHSISAANANWDGISACLRSTCTCK